MKESIKMGIILFLISVVSAGILAGTNELTKGRIEEQQLEKSLEALEDIFGSGVEVENIEPEDNEKVLNIFEVKDGSGLLGYALIHTSKGYDGNFKMMTGISSQGEILGLKEIEHTETNGIGTRAFEASYLDLFLGESVDEESMIDTLSGATMTSSGVKAGLEDAKAYFRDFLAN